MADAAFVRVMTGSGNENVTGGAIDANGDFYVVGRTNSGNFERVNPLAVEFQSAAIGFQTLSSHSSEAQSESNTQEDPMGSPPPGTSQSFSRQWHSSESQSESKVQGAPGGSLPLAKTHRTSSHSSE